MCFILVLGSYNYLVSMKILSQFHGATVSYTIGVRHCIEYTTEEWYQCPEFYLLLCEYGWVQ
jgi:hypothetical protein